MATYTNSITLVAVENGADGKAPIYDIELSNEKIYKRVDSVESNPLVSAINIVYPYTISFQLFKTEEGERTLVDVDDFNYGFYIIGETNISDAAGGSGTQYGELRSYISSKSSSFANLVFIKNSSTNTITININDLVFTTSYGSSADLAGLQKVLQERDIYFLIKVWSGNNNNDQYLLAKAVFSLEFSTPLEVLINNRSFKTIIDNGSMEFTTDGLTVYNKGLKIVDNTDLQNPITLFEYDSGALKIVGSGSFSGELKAASGSFSGAITAKEGSIGGFIIQSDRIISNDGNDISSPPQNPAIQLLSSGKIVAKNIEIGEDASISKYLKLGNAYICNPEYTDANILSGTILKAGNTVLTQEGTLTLGQDSDNQIVISGANSTIWGKNFAITADTATFNNIVATGKISTMVFETNKIQAVGGAMIFKPTFKVQQVDLSTQTIYLDGTFGDAKNHYVYLINSDGSIVGSPIKVISVTTDGSAITFNSGSFTTAEIFSIVDLGIIEDETKPIVIGINSNDSSSGFLLGRGLTISQMNSVSNFELKAFLGDLGEIKKFYKNDNTFLNIKGYGLYSSNVFLTGSLTTRVESSNSQTYTYAGVNTLDGAVSLEDESKIVFWAGSQTASNESIQVAPFRVTEKGSIYASKGEFKGAIISESKIEGSLLVGAQLYTAEIHGTGNTPCLSLYDAKEGIVFYEGVYSVFQGSQFTKGTIYYELQNSIHVITSDETPIEGKTYYTLTNSIEKFKIDENGLSYNNKAFLTITSVSNEDFIQGIFNSAVIGQLKIKDYKISNNLDENINLSLSSQNMALSFYNNELTLNKQVAKFINEQVAISNNLSLGDNESELSYKKTSDGYDLYVYSTTGYIARVIGTSKNMDDTVVYFRGDDYCENGQTFTYEGGETIDIYALDVQGNGTIYINGENMGDMVDGWVLPAANITITFPEENYDIIITTLGS